MDAFKKLGLSEEILKAIEELGFESPTDIQKDAIPRLLAEDKDLIGLAQTGTGKTAAFGLPLIERIDPSIDATQGLILAPTRELGKQIAEQIHMFSKYMDKVNVLVVYGGAAIYNQIKALKKTQHIVIATPGRLIDLIKRKAVHLDQLQYLVLDEADEMLNMGFKEELDEILKHTPAEKLTWLFSATMPSFIKKIVKEYMNEPIEIRIDAKNEVNKNIEHQYTVIRPRDKSQALMRFLDINSSMRGVVFCRTRRDTQELAEYLLQKNYKADALHGDLSQHQRDRVMGRFKKHELQVLIATDVAARGIDVNDLTHVFHHSLPDDNSYYTHRSGRTARAGKKGTSIAFVTGREKHRIDRLQRHLGITFEQVKVPDTASIAEIRMANWATEILEQEATGKLDQKITDNVELILADLSKEELVAKLLTKEMDKLGLDSSKDLNDNSPVRGGGRDRDRGRGRGRDRGRGGRDRDRGRSRDRDRGGRSRDRKRGDEKKEYGFSSRKKREDSPSSRRRSSREDSPSSSRRSREDSPSSSRRSREDSPSSSRRNREDGLSPVRRKREDGISSSRRNKEAKRAERNKKFDKKVKSSTKGKSSFSKKKFAKS